MRLIDVDALLEGRQDHEMISTHTIWNAPTIEAEPVRHGRWIYIRNSSFNPLKICECSVCHRKTYGSLDFCGNCGAKMDEERKTDDCT